MPSYEMIRSLVQLLTAVDYRVSVTGRCCREISVERRNRGQLSREKITFIFVFEQQG